MYMKKRVGAFELVAANGKVLFLLLVTVSATTALYLEVPHPVLNISTAVVGALGTAISFFIAFFSGSAGPAAHRLPLRGEGKPAAPSRSTCSSRSGRPTFRLRLNRWTAAT